MIAILPAAGKGTRMLEVSGGSKELLPIGGRTVLQLVVEEALNAGASRLAVVVSPAKPDLIEQARSIQDAELVTQEVPNGLAPAVALAGSCYPALVLLPDTIFATSSPSKRLVDALNRGFDIAIAVELVSDDRVSKYGIVEWNRESGRISRILEKPQPSETRSRWAIAARFGLSVRTMFFVKQRVAELGVSASEIDLPPILGEAIAAGHAGIAITLEQDETRLDCGNPEGYRHAREVLHKGL